MRKRKVLQRLCVVAALAVALVVLPSAPALATYTHVFSSSFGGAGSGDGQIELLTHTGRRGGSGVAVNSSTHDVYIADTGNHRVDQFSASGAFIRAWGWGVADGSTEALQTCTSGCHAGIPGAGAGQLNEPSFVAVDNSGGPSEGDVYVADRTSAGSTFVIKFAATGSYISTSDGMTATFPIPGPFGQTIIGIATDTSGDLWVYAEDSTAGDPLNGLGVMFEFAQDGTFLNDWTTHEGAPPLGIAVDSAKNLYLSAVGPSKFTSSGALIGSIYLGLQSGVAANSATDDVYIGEGEQIARYSSSCDPSSGHFCTAAETFATGGELNGAGALAVDASNDTVYVSNSSADQVAVFGRTPDVTTGQPSGRTPIGATLSGTVNPDNTPVGDCHFDYVADAEYQAGESDPYAAGGTVACDTLPSGSGSVAVHAEISGLTPGVVYHFRLQATNMYSTSFATDETVPGTPPAVDATSAADVTSATAVLQASINPEGGDTTYHFEYGTSTSYGTDAPVPAADLGSGVGDVPASRRVEGLVAGTVYHYRVVARNSLGTTVGPDRTLTTQPSGGTGSDACPNAAVRAQQEAATLPDCRAYEQVSAPDKNGSPVLGPGDHEVYWQSSPDGGAFTYTSAGVFADAQTGDAVVSPYLASRAQGNWSSHNLLPPQAPGSFIPFPHIGVYSKDLSRGLLINGGGSTNFGQDQPALVPGEPHNINLFLRENSTDSYQLVNLTPMGVAPAPIELTYIGSSDLSHVVFEENAQLTADSPPAGAHAHLYEWHAGAVRLAGILPDGTPVPASVPVRVPFNEGGGSSESVPGDHAVSDDGSRIFFNVESNPSALYLRQNATTTVQVDASRGPGPGGGGRFAVASSDGSRAFFLDDAAQGLTNDTVPGSGINLYRYDVNSGTLSDLTSAAGAEVQGVIGASEDGSYVYFVANAQLAPGASPGNCTGTGNGDPAATCNLYLFHNGVTSFIAAVNGEDLGDWNGSTFTLDSTSVVSPDGRYLAFESLSSLTGYHNLAANGVQCGNATPHDGPHCAEVYLYDAAPGATGKLSCASCNPSGGAPLGASLLGIPGKYDQVYNYMPRYLSDSGRVFFNSLDALAPRDSNGQWDVYEYEPGGIGNCQQSQGCASLVSSGTSPDASLFRDASSTGDDVFFTTSDPLVAQDGDRSLDVYDAKVNGGLASQNELAAPGCGGEACKPSVSGQPEEQVPGSNGVSGQGNVVTPSPAVAAKRRPLTRAQKLARALRVCRSKPKRKRVSCVAQAKRRYRAGTADRKTRTTRARRARNDRRAGR
jgi:Tol biopolymer transport system component